MKEPWERCEDQESPKPPEEKIFDQEAVRETFFGVKGCDKTDSNVEDESWFWLVSGMEAELYLRQFQYRGQQVCHQYSL